MHVLTKMSVDPKSVVGEEDPRTAPSLYPHLMLTVGNLSDHLPTEMTPPLISYEVWLPRDFQGL